MNKWIQLLDGLFTVVSAKPEFNFLYEKIKYKYDKVIIAQKQKLLAYKIIHSDNKSKAVWQIVNNIIGRDKGNKLNIPKSADPFDVAENFNNSFIDISRNLTYNIWSYMENTNHFSCSRSKRLRSSQ